MWSWLVSLGVGTVDLLRCLEAHSRLGPYSAAEHCLLQRSSTMQTDGETWGHVSHGPTRGGLRASHVNRTRLRLCTCLTAPP